MIFKSYNYITIINLQHYNFITNYVIRFLLVNINIKSLYFITSKLIIKVSIYVNIILKCMFLVLKFTLLNIFTKNLIF